MRTILIFLAGDQVNEIEEIRKRHDPLFGLISPHITLVFPFEGTFSNGELKQHIIESVDGLKPISITIAENVTNEEECLYLLVEKGKEKIEELHDRLYRGFLADYLRENIPYIPHVTVGRNADKIATVKIPSLTTKFSYKVEKISVERIGENGESIIEFEVELEA
ncbi:2'-5' RNA ligase family protein [Bacillus sp. DX4.1]|uniref:2'-5' RNA ligase family protein n=1 Tax=Bacillus sp. DX4.1 TaxID=3055867 RepID=UPI0025A23031|nr:2'-5' RNA ligase family protein [Bacillus sp. DX4.1]MDM5188951.1 2'-5' RNA ligase family protein [Bacillus sp. DX4.1]